jgi:exodeoxyribonuclease VII large subunit
MEPIDISHTEEIYTVSRLTREVKFLLEGSFPLLWIEGEISNFSCPNSGHWYFSLKDSVSQVRCAMFKMQNRRQATIPKDGMHVIIKARVTMYEGRGDFQLLVEHLEDAGLGKLQQEFEALKKKLSLAGLFDASHKKSLPLFPQAIGVITSPTGAAIRDILSVLKRRFACIPVIIYPTLVQGESACANIVNAIQIANHRKECDVIILARGGGSLEDLWCFNAEIVAQAIFKSTICIISGIGHEIDFTIADFVADVRAPTPSAAAELVVPHLEKLAESIHDDEKHLQQQHPKRRLAEQHQRLDLHEVALVRLQNKLITALKSRMNNLKEKLFATTPKHAIRNLSHQLHHADQQLKNSLQKSLQIHQKTLSNLAGKLDVLSPLSTLQRGFSIASDKDNKIIRSAKEVTAGDKIRVQLMQGSLKCTVEESSS